MPRAGLDVAHAVEQVRPICDAVRERGVEALLELTERFDGVRPASIRVPEEALDRALAGLPDDVRAGLEEAIARTRLVHGQQKPSGHVTRVVPGGTVTQRWLPVGRVGLYVPGGVAVYPSSVVMNVVPAQAAGVESIAVTSPVQRENPAEFAGMPHPTILAACALLGVREVYGVGGAQAVAMFAYGAADADGTEVCEPTDLVTGPGNIWVVAAKRLLKGVIGIDSEAGPTEIAILADETADPRHVAADLISQAEHDPMAAAVLVTDSPALADAVTAELQLQVVATKHTERVTTALAGQQSGIVLVDDLDAGLEVVDAYAAEHLEIQTRDAAAVAARVHNAGAVFVGAWSPVSLGDYCAGSNHVLPTGGCAIHSSGLGVATFLRSVQVIEYDEGALQGVAGHVVALANAEDLPAHGQAVLARMPGGTVPTTTTSQNQTAPLDDDTARPVPGAQIDTARRDALQRLPIRDDLRGRTPYATGLQLRTAIQLNSNENAHDVPGEVIQAIMDTVREQVAHLNRYPDREFTGLREDLAAYLGHDLEPGQLWAGNGSNEVLQQLLQAFGGPGRTALGFFPSFAMHPIISRNTSTGWVDGYRDGDGFAITAASALEQVRTHDPDLVFLCSPNNPTGTALALDVIEQVYDAARGMVVVDEAYAEFARPGTPSAVTLLPGRERLVVTRTMSKAFTLAGARLGYLAADPAVTDALRLVTLPYHLSSLTQAAARAALWYSDVVLDTVQDVIAQRDRIVAELPGLGLTPVPSDANFVLFGGLRDAPAAFRSLLAHGVLVRDVGIEGHLRVTAGTEEETGAFLTALGSVIKEDG
jgi:histidinol dehydrogenase